MPGSLIAFQLCNRPTEFSCYGLQRRKFRRLALRPKAIQDATQDSVLGTFMNVGIEAVEVAQAGLKPMRPLFEDEEAVLSLPPDAVGKAQLERHVEAGNPQRTGHRNPAEVVDRRTATRDQAINPVQTILASGRDLQHTVGLTSHSGKTRQQGNQQRPVALIEGDVEKNGLTGCGGRGAQRLSPWGASP